MTFDILDDLLNSDLEQWADRRPQGAESNGGPTEHLGNVDADTEWDRTDWPSEDAFLHTHAYNKFLDTGINTLLGRRGTGKSSLINMFKYEIRNGRNEVYEYCWVINEREGYLERISALTAPYLMQMEDSLTRDIFFRLWRWLIKVSALRAFVAAQPNASDDKETELHKKLNEFLFSIGCAKQNRNLKKNTPLEFIFNQFRVLVREYKDSVHQLGPQFLLEEVLTRAKSDEFQDCYQNLTSFLNKRDRQVVVLLDSIEEYNIHDIFTRRAVEALQRAIRRTGALGEKSQVFAKVAFPSEILPHFTTDNSAKQLSGRLFILWQHKDLVCLLAKRLWLWKNKSEISNSKLVQKQLALFDGDYDHSREFIFKVFPKSITSMQGRETDTIVYILRHTQKRPRQLIIAVNSIIDKWLYDDGIGPITSSHIVKGLHEVSSILFSDAVENYSKIYGEAEKLARRTLLRAESTFRWQELALKVRDVAALRQKAMLDAADVSSLLIESGIIGRVGEISNDRDFIIAQVDYQYQVKGGVDFKSSDFVSIHPMFYDALGIRVHGQLVCHPRSSEDEELISGP